MSESILAILLLMEDIKKLHYHFNHISQNMLYLDIV